MTISVESNGDCAPVTTLTDELDQAALHGLLRRLYSLGLPIISVLWIEGGSVKKETRVQQQELGG